MNVEVCNIARCSNIGDEMRNIRKERRQRSGNDTIKYHTITNKSQEVSLFPAGDHKAARNRREAEQTQDINNTKDPQKKYRLGSVRKKIYWRA